ncbi:MAG: hypothetical protein ACWGN2_12205 [Anaerolineales bacterium]
MVNGSYQVRDLQAKLTELDFPIVTAREGQVLDLGKGAELEILGACDRGAVLLLKWGDFRTLLPIGLDFDTLDHLRTHTELKGVTALLLAENGFAPVNPGDWIQDLSPQVVLLSVAAGDLEGLPSPEIINALEGFNLLRTDRNGWIQLTTDGKQMWVEVENR